MDCPKCGTWNPDDKLVCWRCQTEMPKPVEKKKSRPTLFFGLPIWGWILIGILMILMFAGPFLGQLLSGGQ